MVFIASFITELLGVSIVNDHDVLVGLHLEKIALVLGRHELKRVAELPDVPDKLLNVKLSIKPVVRLCLVPLIPLEPTALAPFLELSLNINHEVGLSGTFDLLATLEALICPVEEGLVGPIVLSVLQSVEFSD